MQDNRRYVIEGGRKLGGTVAVQSAKNAIGKQLIASLLTDEPCTFYNVPRITEIDAILDMLGDTGTHHEWLDSSTLVVQTPSIAKTTVSQKYSGFNRSPILMLGPLLQRAGESTVPFIGGCQIGPRPVDFHINALEAMGANIETTEEGYVARTTSASGRLHGTTINLPYPSVGATENVLTTATLAEGTTVISNAAIEPEVVDTILFLQKMGAHIHIDTDRRIIVEGVSTLHGASHSSIPDRIEAASYAAAAVATDGRITVRNARQVDMISFLNALRRVGGGFEVDSDGITFFRTGIGLRPVHLETDVHPGFMTDWQQPFVVLLTQASGVSVVHETVYENRFGYTDTLRVMGADIDLTSACLGSKPCRFTNKDHMHSAIVRGVTKLRGACVEIPDLRAGFAYVIAALVADGASEISGLRYIERGYAGLSEKLEAIGAAIDVIELAEEEKLIPVM
jgi:UDP-N-acetylglucosamine 1-carboxyvinyltransferase